MKDLIFCIFIALLISSIWYFGMVSALKDIGKEYNRQELFVKECDKICGVDFDCTEKCFNWKLKGK
jgi:hypothetical protein